MPTPDGIANHEWNRVRQLATAVLDATNREQESHCRSRLFAYLELLEDKYGAKASILATRADFCEDLHRRNELLHRAYASAEATDDAHNALYVAHSLAELHLDELGALDEGAKWLECMRGYLVRVDDGWFVEEYDRLRRLAF